MAFSQTLASGKTGYIQSLVFRKQWLKQLKKSAAVETVSVCAFEAEESDRFRREPASTHEAALWLSYMASDFRVELARLLSDLGNLHRHKVDDVAEELNLFLSDAENALHSYSSRSARLENLPEAKRILKTLEALQTNLPVWNLARGLQLFLQDCKALKQEVVS